MASTSKKIKKCSCKEDPFAKFAFVLCDEKEEKFDDDKKIMIPIGTKKTYRFETKELLYELVYPNFASEFGATNSLYTGIIVTNKTDHKISEELVISDFTDPTDSKLTYQVQIISPSFYAPGQNVSTGFEAVLALGQKERNSLIVSVNPSSSMTVNMEVSLINGVFTVKFINVTNPSSPHEIGSMIFTPELM